MSRSAGTAGLVPLLCASAAAKQTTGVWDLVKAMSDPDINRALTFGIKLLKGLEQGLQE